MHYAIAGVYTFEVLTILYLMTKIGDNLLESTML